MIFAGPQFMFNSIKEVRATDDPEEESEGSLFSEPTPSEAEDPYTKWGVGLGASVSVYLPAILGTNGLVAPGVTYTFSKPTYQGRERTVFVDDSASLASNTTTDSAVYTAKQHTLTAGIGLGLNQAKKGTFQLIAPVQVGASWGNVEATVASKPGTPLQSRYVGGAFTFGVSGIVRVGKHAYLLVNIIEAHLAFGDLKGDGMPFRESDRFNASYLPLSLQLGVGF